MKQRPPALVAIVLYKLFEASLLAVTSVALLLALKHYDGLEDFAGSYVLDSKHKIITWFLKRVTNLTPRSLAFSGVGAGIYAIVTAIEAIGLWYEQTWAEILVIVLVATSVPLEVYELLRGFTVLKLIILTVNIAMLWYLVKRFRDKAANRQNSRQTH